MSSNGAISGDASGSGAGGADGGAGRGRARCPFCQQVRSRLADHIRHMHSNEERPFGCHICGERFKTKSNRRSHCARTHSNKKYKCDQCGAELTCKPNLNQHIKSTHEGEQYTCHKCGRAFAYPQSLSKHLKRCAAVAALDEVGGGAVPADTANGRGAGPNDGADQRDQAAESDDAMEVVDETDEEIEDNLVIVEEEENEADDVGQNEVVSLQHQQMEEEGIGAEADVEVHYVRLRRSSDDFDANLDMDVAEAALERPSAEKELPLQYYKSNFWAEIVGNQKLRSGASREWVKGQEERLTIDGLLCLRDGQWLNADIIDAYLEFLCLTHAHARIHYIPTHAVLSYQGMRALPSAWYWCLADARIVLAPAHLNNNHWAMAVVDVQRKHLVLMDSMNHGYTCDAKREFMKTITEMLQGVSDEQGVTLGGTAVDDGWRTEERMAVPQQSNGIDCGIFALLFARYTAMEKPINFEQRHIAYFRRRICHDIIGTALIESCEDDGEMEDTQEPLANSEQAQQRLEIAIEKFQQKDKDEDLQNEQNAIKNSKQDMEKCQHSFDAQHYQELIVMMSAQESWLIQMYNELKEVRTQVAELARIKPTARQLELDDMVAEIQSNFAQHEAEWMRKMAEGQKQLRQCADESNCLRERIEELEKSNSQYQRLMEENVRLHHQKLECIRKCLNLGQPEQAEAR